MPPETVEDLQRRLSGILARTEEWARALSDLPDALADTVAAGPGCVTELRGLRTRSASTLITIAMIGAFSSGKSSLVSGLQGRLDLVDVGGSAPAILGMLPSATEPVNACPARVVPVTGGTEDGSSADMILRVRFEDSADWEEVAADPSPEMMAAYIARRGDEKDRLAAHRGRKVAEAEILLSGYEIPAMLYDLPGYGSPDRLHDAIIKSAMNDADCFIFTTPAGHSLADDELELIKVLYDHCRLGGKRVLWVVTQIDKEPYSHLPDKIPNWRRTVIVNNKELEDRFRIGGQPDSSFIGEGFMAVSVVDEARAKLRPGAGAGGGSGARPDHGMDHLRQAIRAMAEAESGKKHVMDVAVQARALLRPLKNEVAERWLLERTPVAEQARRLARDQAALARAEEALGRVREDLEDTLKARARNVSASFDGLAARFHDQLDAEIRNSDAGSKEHADRIEASMTQVLEGWVKGPHGAEEQWNQQLDEFEGDIAAWVRGNVETDEVSGPVHGSRFDLGLLDFRGVLTPTEAKRWQAIQRARGVLGFTGPVVGVTSAVTGAGAAAATAAVGAAGSAVIAASLAAIPALVGVVIIGMVIFRKTRDSAQLQAGRERWIGALDGLERTLRDQAEESLIAAGSRMIDELVKTLTSYRDRLRSTVDSLQRRIDEPGSQESQALSRWLERPSEEGGRLVDDLDELIHQCR